MENTFEMAKMNIRINGKNFEDMDADEQGEFSSQQFADVIIELNDL